MHTRRQFGKLAGGGALGIGLGITTMGVSCGSVFNQILKYVPVALQALTALVAVLSGNGIAITPAVNTALTLAKAALADLQADVTAYENAPAASKATLLGKISTALSVVEGSIQQFWNDLNLPSGNIATIVAGVLGVVLSTLAAFAAQLPAPAATEKRSLPRMLPVVAQKRTVKQMKSDINNFLKGTGQQVY